MPSTSTVLFAVGTILILHSAYSCSHYRELLQSLRDSGMEEDVLLHQPRLPLDVWMEVAFGFGSILISELIRPGSALRPIQQTAASKRGQPPPLMAPPYRTRDFDIYATRAKVL